MSKERTLVLIKPDGVKRELIGEIMLRFEKRSFKIIALKMIQIDEKLAEKHYMEHIKKPFFPELINFITSGPTVAAVIESENVISITRKMMGATSFTDAMPGTIRGDFAYSTTENIIHGSDSPESAQREIALFFSENELVGG